MLLLSFPRATDIKLDSAQCAKLSFVLEACGLQPFHSYSSYNKTAQTVVGHAVCFVPEPRGLHVIIGQYKQLLGMPCVLYQNHVAFLHEEFLKLPSFPRKALETEFDMYSGEWGKVSAVLCLPLSVSSCSSTAF